MENIFIIEKNAILLIYMRFIIQKRDIFIF